MHTLQFRARIALRFCFWVIAVPPIRSCPLAIGFLPLDTAGTYVLQSLCSVTIPKAIASWLEHAAEFTFKGHADRGTWAHYGTKKSN